MKFEVEKVNIIRGEFQILPAELMTQSGKESKEPTLVLSCNYSLINRKGFPLALGVASNMPNLPNANITTPLSDDTLQAFHKFFSLLEQDIANAFEGTTLTTQRTALERLLPQGAAG